MEENIEEESGAIIITIMEHLHIIKDLLDLVIDLSIILLHSLSLVNNLTILPPSNTIAIKC